MNPTVALHNGRTSDLFSPIAGDLEQVEEVLRTTVESSQPGVGRLLSHLAHYRGKRLRRRSCC